MSPLPIMAATIPQELKERSQWVNWNIELREDKETKVPYQPSCQHAMSNTPRTWSGVETCMRALEDDNGRTRFRGIGFVFNHDYTGTDFDNCVDPKAGEITNPDVARMVHQLNSYTEYSQSGCGLHVINNAAKPGTKCRSEKPVKIEMYDVDRFFCMTGDHFPGSPTTIESNQDAVNAVYYEVFGAEDPPQRVNVAPGESSSLEDSDVIRKATAAKNGDKFKRLFDGDASDYGDDDSAADLALCDMLKFWCGDDSAQIDSVFRKSRLMRAKWDEPRGAMTYGERTIKAAMFTPAVNVPGTQNVLP